MTSRKSDRLRMLVIGVAATGMCWQSIPAIGQAVNTAPANQKKNVAKKVPVQASQEPRPLPVMNDATLMGNSVQLVSQSDATAGGKSEVQKQLEALYEQDGREMPDMSFAPLQPIQPSNGTPSQPPANTAPAGRPAPAVPQVPQATQKPARTTQGYTQYLPRTQATPYPAPINPQPARGAGTQMEPPRPPQAQPKQNAVTGFFKKLTTSKKPLSTEAPVPPDIVNSVPAYTAPANAVPGLSSAPPAVYSNAAMTSPPQVPGKNMIPASATSQAPRPVTPPKMANATLSNIPAPPSAYTQPLGTAAIPSPSESPKSTLSLPPLARQPLPLQTASVPSELPPLMTEVQPRTLPSKSTPSTQKIATAEIAATSDFPNPFPDVPEAQADVKLALSPKATPVIAPKKQDVISPKVEAAAPNVIESTPETAIETAIEPAIVTEDESDSPVAKTEEDPFAVDAKGFNEPSINGDLQPNNDPTAPSLGDQPALAPVPVDDKPVAEPKRIEPTPAAETGDFVPPKTIQETHLEKMRRIRERFGMKGLKGFCPVTLRDDRELKDAKTEYYSMHRNQKFHFASAEARDKFESNPFRYVPAAYGADVVALSRDKDVLEGTLDFALWYKGRLYLFGSQANYDVFIAEPTKFATIEGIE